MYHSSLLSRSIALPMNQIGGNIDELLHLHLKPLEGKCAEEGYIQLQSIKIVRYSCGVIKGSTVVIHVVFECNICNPVAGESFTCVVEHNTRAGIKGRLDASENPFILFLARDHHNTIPNFSDITENTKMKVTILGQRFQIHDSKISIIAVLHENDIFKEPELVEPASPIYVPKTYEEPEQKPEQEEKEEKEEDVFVFMAKSSDKPKAGKGSHEHLIKGHSYPELDKITGWRSQLSNFDVAEFEWTGENVLPKPFPKGTRWNSIEHVFQASKFELYGHEKEANRFTLNSGDAIGKGDGFMAKRNNKLVKLSDMKQWNEIQMKVMADAAKAKYTQNPERMRMLKATIPAKLVHLQTMRGQKSQLVPFTHLEEIREL